MPGSAGDPTMVMDSPSTAGGATGSERTRDNQSVDSLTHRLERIELLNDHRAFQPFAEAKAQGKAYSEEANEQKVHQMGQPFMSVFAASVKGLVTENPGGTGLAEVEVQWLNQFGKQLMSAGFRRCGTFARPERVTSVNSSDISDANARPCSSGGGAENQRAGTHPPQSSLPSKGDRTGSPARER